MKLSCEHCSFRSHRRRELIRHSRVHRHRCIHCDKMCSTKPELVRHIQELHQVCQATQTEPSKTPHPRRPLSPKRQSYHKREVRRPRWEPARYSRPTPRPEVPSKVVRPKPRPSSPSPVFSDTDPLGLLDPPVEINF